MSRIIGIDFGKNRSGLAMTDVLQISINPIGAFTDNELELHLKEILSVGDIEDIAVGWPTHIDGNEPALCKKINKWINKMIHWSKDIVIHKIDESYTSSEARTLMNVSNKSNKHKKLKGNLDALSAVLIIKRYLESLE